VAQAIAVREIVAVAASGEFAAADRRELVEHLRQSSASLLAAVDGAPAGSALELRYLTEPQPQAPTRVRLAPAAALRSV
jgi:hypothetical protein